MKNDVRILLATVTVRFSGRREITGVRASCVAVDEFSLIQPRGIHYEHI